MSINRFRFRVWDPKENVYDEMDITSPDILVDVDASQKATDNGNGCVDVLWRSLTGCVIEQWTGLSDINGVDLWEGDIVRALYRGPEGSSSMDAGWDGLPIVTKRVGEPGVIEYMVSGGTIRGAFALVCRASDGISVSYQCLNHCRWTNGDNLWFERLGNIHEHPHLLTP